MLTARSSLACLFFSCHRLVSSLLHCELGILVPSGGHVPQSLRHLAATSCPVCCSTSVFVTLSFQLTRVIFRKFCWWNTSSFFCILLVLFHVSLAYYMAVDMTTAVYSCNFILSPRELDFHMLLSLLKTPAALASQVFPFSSTSPSSIWHCQDMWSGLHILALPVLCALAGSLTYGWSW